MTKDRIKIFSATIGPSDENVKYLEDQINKWLGRKGNEIKVTQRLQTISDRKLVISIFYKKLIGEPSGYLGPDLNK